MIDKTLKKILIGTVLLFFIIIILGYLSAPFVPDEIILEALKQAFAPFLELTPWELTFAIFIHNALRVLLVILLGIIIGIIPFVFLVANGLIIGIVIYEVAAIQGWGVVMAGLIPHGIIEIPAAILGISLGFRTGLEAIKWLSGKESQVKSSLKTGLKTFLILIAPALFLAALIEVFITPQILEVFR